MKKTILSLALLCAIASCKNAERPKATSLLNTKTSGAIPCGGGHESNFILADTANHMIASYLESIDGDTNDSTLRSFIVNAKDLREYLTSDTGMNITKLKVVFAHTREYIASGGYGRPANFTGNNFTIILAGFNDSSNYILRNNELVLDYSAPCPACCPVSGTAASNLFPINHD